MKRKINYLIILFANFLIIGCDREIKSGHNIRVYAKVTGSMEQETGTNLFLKIELKNISEDTVKYIEMDSSWQQSFIPSLEQFTFENTKPYGAYGDFPRIISIAPKSSKEKILVLRTPMNKTEILHSKIKVGFNFHELVPNFKLSGSSKDFKSTGNFKELYDMKQIVWSNYLALNFNWETN